MAPADPYAGGTDAAVVAAACDWLAAGHSAHLLTVVRTWGASPRPPGALMARRDDGVVVGSVSGGCVEADLPGHLPAPGHPPVRLVYGAEAGEGERFGLPCGGTLELLAEPLTPHDAAGLTAIREALARGETVRRQVLRDSGAVRLGADDGGPDLLADEAAVAKRFGPAWRLFIVGGGELGGHLAAMARRLAYGVTVCEPRAAYREGFAEASVTLDRRMPDDAVAAWGPDPRGAVVTTSHDPKLDDLALMAALPSPAFYVGALGSTRTNDRRRQRLAELGLPEPAVARLRGPMGLAIGSHTPPEIAVAVLAELTAVRNDRDPRPEQVAATAHARLSS